MEDINKAKSWFFEKIKKKKKMKLYLEESSKKVKRLKSIILQIEKVEIKNNITQYKESCEYYEHLYTNKLDI